MDFRPGRARVRLGKKPKEVFTAAEPQLSEREDAEQSAIIRGLDDDRAEITIKILPANRSQPQAQPQSPVVFVNSGQQQVSEPAVEEEEPEPILPQPEEDSFFDRVRRKR